MVSTEKLPALDQQRLLSLIKDRLPAPKPVRQAAAKRYGRLTEIGPTLLKAYLPWARLGELCQVLPQQIPAEVVSLQGKIACLSPFEQATGLQCGQLVFASGQQHRIALEIFYWEILWMVSGGRYMGRLRGKQRSGGQLRVQLLMP